MNIFKGSRFISFLSYVIGIGCHYLYLKISHAKIFTGDAREFEPISRFLGMRILPGVQTGPQVGCLGNLFGIVILLVLWAIHFSIALGGWIVVSLVVQRILFSVIGNTRAEAIRQKAEKEFQQTKAREEQNLARAEAQRKKEQDALKLLEEDTD
jgi:hypothetical protein